jgi:hypothetical protein
MISPCCLFIRVCPSVCVPLMFFVFYTVRVVSQRSGLLVLPRASCKILMRGVWVETGSRLRSIDRNVNAT